MPKPEAGKPEMILETGQMWGQPPSAVLASLLAMVSWLIANRRYSTLKNRFASSRCGNSRSSA
jgi:hypothetical protein